MQQFYELVQTGTTFSLRSINEAYDKSLKELADNGTTSVVKNLQMLNLQKMIHALGMFSVVEGYLQKELGSKNALNEVEMILEQTGELALKEDFRNYNLAMDMLKHGKAPEFIHILERISHLTDTKDPAVCLEGDVSCVHGLPKVNDSFIMNYLDIIEKIISCITLKISEGNK